MEDYTLSELVKLDADQLEEAIEARKENIMVINQTLEDMPDSPHFSERVIARRHELMIVRLLEITQSFQHYFK